jgi:hypothetical protein
MRYPFGRVVGKPRYLYGYGGEENFLFMPGIKRRPSISKYSITPIIWNNWDRETFGYAENPDNWIFL